MKTAVKRGSPAQKGSRDSVQEEKLFRKVTLRLLPFLFLLYIVAYLDRVNVSFAALDMKSDLGLSNTVYGAGAGIFFLGYFLFEVPSNLILQRVGARVWMARIMVTWGLLSSAMALAQGEKSFYALRFLLGLAEAGFFPGMIFYLTGWFPAGRRARAVSLFMTATAMAGVIGGPVSGLLLQMKGLAGLAGWQWLFLLEGLPAVLLGGIVFFVLPDGPAQASWLSPLEKTWLRQRLAAEARTGNPHTRLGKALASGRLWHLSAIYFCVVMSLYGIILWLPQIMQAFGGFSNLKVGMLSALPWVTAAVAMVLVGRHSDLRQERRWHLALSALVGALGLVLSGLATDPWAALGALTLAAAGIESAMGPFWSLPPEFLKGTAAAGGIALINSLGNLGGYAGPSAVGWIKDRTGSFSAGLFLLAGGLVVAALLSLSLRRKP